MKLTLISLLAAALCSCSTIGPVAPPTPDEARGLSAIATGESIYNLAAASERPKIAQDIVLFADSYATYSVAPVPTPDAFSALLQKYLPASPNKAREVADLTGIYRLRYSSFANAQLPEAVKNDYVKNVIAGMKDGAATYLAPAN